MEPFDPSAIFDAPAESPSAPESAVDSPESTGTPSFEDARHPGGGPAASAAPAAEMFEIPGHGPVSRDEAIKGYLRQQDYTRKTMATAAQAREFETLRQQAAAMERTLVEARALLSNRQKLAAYLQQLPGGEPELAADQVLTTAEVQALQRRDRGELEASFNDRLRQTEERIVTQSYQQQYESRIDNHLGAIGTKYPEITAVPGMEMLLRNAVSSQNPRSIEDALSLFDRAAAFYSDKLKGVAKRVIAPPNNPLTRGIEPPASAGGRLGTAEPVDDGFSGGVKDPALRDLVFKDIERALAGRA